MNPPKQAPATISAARIYHAISLVWHAAHLVLANAARLPQLGHLILFSPNRSLKLPNSLVRRTLPHDDNSPPVSKTRSGWDEVSTTTR